MSTNSKPVVVAQVQLQSGGDIMTVEGFRKGGRVICVWFDNRGAVRRSSFPVATLRLLAR